MSHRQLSQVARCAADAGQVRKGRVSLQIECLFGRFELQRDYYHHEGRRQGHYPADAALGLEGGYTPGLARVLCLEGADEASYQKAELHLAETGGIGVSARQIQRLVQRVPERPGPEPNRGDWHRESL